MTTSLWDAFHEQRTDFDSTGHHHASNAIGKIASSSCQAHWPSHSGPGLERFYGSPTGPEFQVPCSSCVGIGFVRRTLLLVGGVHSVTSNLRGSRRAVGAAGD